MEEIALQFGKIATIMIRFQLQTLIIVKEEWMTSLLISSVALLQQAYSMDQYPTKVLSLRLQKRLLAVLTRSVVVAIYANNWNKKKIVNKSNRINYSRQLIQKKNMLNDSKLDKIKGMCSNSSSNTTPRYSKRSLNKRKCSSRN